MPKMKSHRGAAKRFKATGTGKLKRNQAFKRHILTKKSSKMKRQLRGTVTMAPSNEKVIKKILPYL